MATEQNLQPVDGATIVELESLKQRLAEYEDRQKEFDDLRLRIDAYERQKVSVADDVIIEKRSKQVVESDDVGIDEKLLDDHRENIRKVFTRQSDIHLIDLQKEYLKKKIDR